MAKCKKTEAMGGIINAIETAGKDVSEALPALKTHDRVSYSNSSSKTHHKGSEQGLEGFKERVTALKDKGVKAGTSAYFRNPMETLGKDIVEPMVEAATNFKKKVIAEKMGMKEARALWKQEVVPVIKKQQEAFQAKGAHSYIQQRADSYFKDALDGVEFFATSIENPLAKMAKTGAANITGLSPVIAGLDMFELVAKGMTNYNPWHFTKGMATLLMTKGPKAFGRLAELEKEGLYYGSPLSKQGGKLEWIMDHIDPQYYSNNFLTNGAAYIGRSAGVAEREAIRKIAFIPEPLNVPQYMRDARFSAEVTWARYSVEAAKFYAQNWANLGKAIKAGDPKKFVSATGALATYYGGLSLMTGSKSTLPPGVTDIISILSSADSEEDAFKKIDEKFNLNLMKKATGVDVGHKLQIGMPLFGLSWSNVQSKIKQSHSKTAKSIEAVQEGDWMEAGKLGFDAMHAGLSLKYRFPLLTKTSKVVMDLSWDYARDEIDEEEAALKAGEKFLGAEAVESFK